MEHINDFHPELKPYLSELQKAGFKVYMHKGATPRRTLTYAVYSRVSESGRELFGIVQLDEYWRLGQTLKHSMPIKPSREYGSAMFIEPIEQVLSSTVAYAELVTRETNWNRLVGEQRNYFDASNYVVADTIESE